MKINNTEKQATKQKKNETLYSNSEKTFGKQHKKKAFEWYDDETTTEEGWHSAAAPPSPFRGKKSDFFVLLEARDIYMRDDIAHVWKPPHVIGIRQHFYEILISWEFAFPFHPLHNATLTILIVSLFFLPLHCWITYKKKEWMPQWNETRTNWNFSLHVRMLCSERNKTWILRKKQEMDWVVAMTKQWKKSKFIIYKGYEWVYNFFASAVAAIIALPHFSLLYTYSSFERLPTHCLLQHFTISRLC